MKTILFCRVSSREQEETGYSLPAQEKLLQDYSEKKDFKIAKKFSISESASGKYQRKSFDEMLDYVRKNDIKIIICEKVDRLTRNLKDAVSINEWLNENTERQVHFVKENCVLSKDSKSNDKFIWNIKVSTAQYYIDNLSEEVKKGQKEKIAQGWLPTKPPLGYKTEGEKGHKIHILDEKKSLLVKKMFEFYASGNYSLKKLVEKMFEEGLRTNGGNKLVKSRLADLLTDPFYIGKIRWNNEIYDGKHEALVSEEVFNLVQRVLKGKTTPRYTKHSYLFRGFIKCEECGGLITWEKHKGITYGHCNHYRNCSQRTWVREPEAERQISELFCNLQIKKQELTEWIKQALKESHKDEAEYHCSALNELNARLGQIQKRLDNLYDDKVDEKINKEFYESKFKKYSEEKDSVLNSIKQHSDASNKYFELGINIFELSQKAPDLYQNANLEEKQQLIKLVFENLYLLGDKINYVYSKPFDIIATAVESTNSSKELNSAKNLSKIFELSNSSLKTNKIGAFSPEKTALLAGWDAFRTSHWINYIKYPERLQEMLLSCLKNA